jgi:hypothetical protein
VLETVRKELSEAITLTSSLSELEQQVFRRVNYIPLTLSVVSPPSGMYTNTAKDSFFTQKIPDVFYPSIEDLEEFLSTSQITHECSKAKQRLSQSTPKDSPPDFLSYDFPDELSSSNLRQRYRHYTQKY